MNSRIVCLIRMLLDGKSRSITHIATQLNTSQRLIRYDIEKANVFLTENDLPLISIHRGEGAYLVFSDGEKEKLLELLAGLDAYKCYPNPSQRKDYILMSLLAQDGFITSQYLADLLQVSKSSIDKDLLAVRKEELPDDIILEGRTGKGIRITGEERQLRNMMFGLASKYIRFEDYLNGKKEAGNYIDKIVQQLTAPNMLQTLTKAVLELELNQGKRLTFETYKELIIYLSVISCRIQKGFAVRLDIQELKLLRTTKEYLSAMFFTNFIEKQSGLEFSPDEIGLVTTLLLSAKYVSHEEYQKENWAQVQAVSDALIKGMEKKLGLAFSKDKELYHALQQHLGPGLARLKNRMPVNNPNLALIRHEYPDISKTLTELVHSSEFDLFHDISDNEIGYITLHFCASAERHKRKRPICNIVIVCTHGVGTGYLIKEMLCAHFPNIRILEIATRKDLEKQYSKAVDIIVSSVPMYHPDIPVVVVNAIPNDADFQAVSEQISLLKHNGDREEDIALGLFKDIFKIIQRNCTVENTQELLNSMLDSFHSHGLTIHPTNVQPSLSELLCEECVRANVRARDWEDAVRQAGALITDMDNAGSEFIRSMVDTVKEMGPYIVVAPGIAMPHGKMGVGIKNLAMSLITLEQPVNFSHPINDPVSLLLCIAPIDNYSHLQALSDFMDLLHTKKIEAICAANSTQNILAILQS